MIVSLIVAMDEKSGIGMDNQIPWYLPSDLKRFKTLTMGHHLVVGRKTFESIGKPLPGRQLIVVTHRKDYHPAGCLVVNSLRAAIKLAQNNHENELFIIGGGDIFKQAIGLADKIYLTAVHADVDKDTFFPKIDSTSWKLEMVEKIDQNEKDEYKSDFMVFIRNYNKQG